MKKIKYIVFLFSVIFSYSQVNIGIYNFTDFNDNPFRLPVKEKSTINQTGFFVQKNFDSLDLSYNGDYYSFSDLQDRNYYEHNISASIRNNQNNYSLLLSQRFNKYYYDYFNYSSLGFYFSRSMTFSQINSELSLASQYTGFSMMNTLNNISLDLNLKLNKSFESGSTIILTPYIGYQYFTTKLSNLPNPYFVKAGADLRLAQSILENVGIAYQFSYSKILAFSGMSQEKWEYGFGDETLYYDNPYSFNSSVHLLELTYFPTEKITLKAGLSFSKKDYKAQNIFIDEQNYDYNITRNDTQTNYYLYSGYTLNLSEKSDLELYIYYNSVNNKSNSYWYGYDSKSFSFGLQFGL